MIFWILTIAIVSVVLWVNLSEPIAKLFRKPPAGTWAYHADSTSKLVQWDLKIPTSLVPTVAAHVLQWRLFYLMQQPEETILLSSIQRVLEDPNDSDWSRVDTLESSATSFGLGGDVQASGMLAGYPGVIGAQGDRVGAALGSTILLVQHALQQDDSGAFKRSVFRLIEMHSELGPVRDMAKISPRTRLALGA